MKTIAIIGAGASGLACLKTLLPYQDDFHILLFDRNPSIAKKIGATGNGHCNLSNDSLSIDSYGGEIEPLFKHVKQFDIESFCMDLGFLTRKKGNLYYPYSQQAKTVVQAFETIVKESATELHLNTKITDIIPQENGYLLVDENKVRYFACYVVICAGGKAGQGFGTDGQIFDVLKGLNIYPTKLSPSLVSLVTSENVKKLKGARVHGTFTLKNNNQVVASLKGEALFNEQGISGIACMMLSRFLDFDPKNHYTLHCHLVDELDEKRLYDYYKTKGADYFGILSDKLAEYLNFTPTKDYNEFVNRLTNLTFHIKGTRDFAYAQVTRGGIPLRYLDDCLMVKHLPGIYLCGEILNIDGDCGGFNLHFAFATGQHVAKSIINSRS